MVVLNESPVVTVGMPVFNGAEHIENALNAILVQTFRDFILIVSDNASTDDTWDILKTWANRDERIVLYRQQENIGAAGNFIFVLEKAKTEYFMWHACDDWLAPNYLEELVRIMTSDSECALACPVTINCDLDGSPAPKESFPPPLAQSRLGRITEQLARPQGTRIYGLFRTEVL
jgi:glycosyltransferase involved in cell wall biosynthesis